MNDIFPSSCTRHFPLPDERQNLSTKKDHLILAQTPTFRKKRSILQNPPHRPVPLTESGGKNLSMSFDTVFRMPAIAPATHLADAWQQLFLLIYDVTSVALAVEGFKML
jgi:hypothetical protein